jgi:cell division protein FtsB
MNTSAFMSLRAGERAHASNEDLAFVTNRLHALQDENAVLRRQAADLTRHNESLRKRKMVEKHMRENTR